LVIYEEQKSISHASGGWEVPALGFGLVETFLLHLHMVEAEGKLTN
jgi:hypothetical protein